ARARVGRLRADDLSGYVLKKGSPSCGIDVEVRRGGRAARRGRGLFAQALLERFPNLPVEEEGRLSDLEVRANWLTRVVAYRRLRSLRTRPRTIDTLVAFHAAYELVLLARSPKTARDLRRIVTGGGERTALRAAYEAGFMRALSRLPTRAGHTRALRRATAHLGSRLDEASRAALDAGIDGYRHGLRPLSAPLSLLRRLARRFDVEYLLAQVYLDPLPGIFSSPGIQQNR
ncbi:MAG: YbgA family protein, partial [Candidatus Binatia bacterium]